MSVFIALPVFTAELHLPFPEQEPAAHLALLRANGYGPDEHAEALRSALDAVRAAAAHLLARRDDAPGDRDLLLRALLDADEEVQAWAAWGLARRGDAKLGRARLIELTRRAPSWGDHAPLIAADLLARLGDRQGLESLRRALVVADSGREVVRRLYPFLLAEADAPGPVTETLNAALQHEDPGVRRLAHDQLQAARRGVSGVTTGAGAG